MWRNVGAVLLGLIVGSMANMAIVMVNFQIFPMPEGMDQNDPAAMTEYISGLPTAAFLVAIAAHMAQAGLGGWVAARVGASRPVVLALVVATLTLVGGVANLLMIGGPAWMWVEVPLYLLVGWGVGTLEARRRAASAAA